MSRSHRKNPIVTEGSFSGWSKRMKQKFNRKLRRTTGVEDIPDGNAYRKMNESWDISDYSFRTPWLAYWQLVKHTGISSKEAYAEWKKMYWSK